MCSKIPVTDSGAFTVTPPGADVIFNEAALSVPSDSSIGRVTGLPSSSSMTSSSPMILSLAVVSRLACGL